MWRPIRVHHRKLIQHLSLWLTFWTWTLQADRKRPVKGLCWQRVEPKSQAQYWPRFDSPARRVFFSQGQLSVHTLFTVFVQPPCAITYSNICPHVKNPKHWQPYKLCTHSCFGHAEMLHTLIGMAIAALKVIVASRPEFPARDKWIVCFVF